ncbi:MAG: hypothetical protein PUH02_00780 [bacterium]|nr:hypothetical protein [bacterium]
MKKRYVVTVTVFAILFGSIIPMQNKLTAASEITTQKVQGKFLSGNTSATLNFQTNEEGKYYSYEWSKGNCYKRYVVNGTMQRKKIKFQKSTKKYVRSKAIQTEWQDQKGNFFFVTEKVNKKKIVTTTLHKVNKSGKIVKKVLLNNWLKISKKGNGFYILSYLEMQGNIAVCEYYDTRKKAIVYIDCNKNCVVKQIDYAAGLMQEPGVVSGKRIVGLKKQKLVVASIPKLRKIAITSKNKIYYGKVKKSFQKKIPQEKGQVLADVFGKKGKVYLLTASGYYEVRLATISYQKLASVDNIAILHQKSIYNEEMEKRYYTLISAAAISKTQFYIMEYSSDPDCVTAKSLWLCTVN